MAKQLTSIFEQLQRRRKLVFALLGVLTAAFVIPFLALAPGQSASNEPDGDVFTARDRLDDTFVSSVHTTFLIAEPESGNLLRAETLNELFTFGNNLRADEELGATLFSFYDAESQTNVTGVLTIADLVDGQLRSEGSSLPEATDADVQRVASELIERFGVSSSVLGLSAQTTQNADGEWISPATRLVLLSDNNALGFGNTSINLGGDTDVEEFDRRLQEVFRADGWMSNGVAIDVNLTSQEQGAIAGPFIGFTILAVLVLVGLTFRSYWVLATVSVAFMSLIIWLKGITNLIGLKDDLVLSLIVPVAMISFGVDFAFHAVGRYREERAEGRSATPAFVSGLTAVSGALALALFSDATAFLSNLTSGIESINQFGLGAAIALAAAYLLLGIATPLAIAWIEDVVPVPTPGRRSTALRVLAGALAASLTMASVLLMVFVLPAVGVALAVATTAAVLLVPVLLLRRRDGVRAGDADIAVAGGSLAAPVGRGIAALARHPRIIIPVAVLISAVAAFYAVQVPVRFDVQDFFSRDTNFVQSLDQADLHVGDLGGEQARLYIEADLTNPENLAEIAETIETIRQLPEDAPLARTPGGEVEIVGGVLDVFETALGSTTMVGLVAEQTGVELTDTNVDAIPDTPEQIEALVAVATEWGVPLDAERLLLTPDDVRTSVELFDDQQDRTVFDVAVTGSGEQSVVTETRNILTPIADDLGQSLEDSFVQVTGSPFIREAALNATNRALLTSLPVAFFACLLISALFLRSLRYGLASVLPIVMVVAWLYGFMFLAGFAINLVTATIAAVSIGIGIDFAIHFIARYREELERHGVRDRAVQIAGEGTGLALVASAISSSIGFGILALAPMPLFAAYGLLTALMIGMALVATLVVLPSVLVSITRDADPISDSPPTAGLEGLEAACTEWVELGSKPTEGGASARSHSDQESEPIVR